MNDLNPKPKIVLEDLLQIKRMERPPAEFWSEFEKELRSKQLAAFVHPALPWWRSLVTAKALIRVYAPLGAAAVVALSFAPFPKVSGSQVAIAKRSQTVMQQVAEPAVSAVATASRALADGETAETASARIVQGPIDSECTEEAMSGPKSVIDPAATERLLAMGTATVKVAGQALAQMASLVESLPVRTETPRISMVEPLTQLATPRDSRRARLLAYSVAYDPHAAGSADVARSRERITRQISDQSIYDSISRLGVSGDRVSIKF